MSLMDEDIVHYSKHKNFSFEKTSGYTVRIKCIICKEKKVVTYSGRKKCHDCAP